MNSTPKKTPKPGSSTTKRAPAKQPQQVAPPKGENPPTTTVSTPEAKPVPASTVMRAAAITRGENPPTGN